MTPYALPTTSADIMLESRSFLLSILTHAGARRNCENNGGDILM